MKITTNEILSNMDAKGIFTTKVSSFSEYTDNLVKLRNNVVKLTKDESEDDYINLQDAIDKLKLLAVKKNLQDNLTVQKAIDSLCDVDRELRTVYPGIGYESVVAKSLQSVDRPEVTVYKNVYLSNGKDKVVADNIVLTNNGVILLEVKKITDNITIDENGKLLIDGKFSYDKASLSEVMSTKRKLLAECLQNKFAENNIDMAISVDSYIVFVTPDDKEIIVDDNGSEKWCFSNEVNLKVDTYSSEINYSKEELESLKLILGEMETCKRAFSVNDDFSELKKNIAEGLALLLNDESKEKEEKAIRLQQIRRKRMKAKARKKKKILVSSVLGVSLLGGIALTAKCLSSKRN